MTTTNSIISLYQTVILMFLAAFAIRCGGFDSNGRSSDSNNGAEIGIDSSITADAAVDESSDLGTESGENKDAKSTDRNSSGGEVGGDNTNGGGGDDTNDGAKGAGEDTNGGSNGGASESGNDHEGQGANDSAGEGGEDNATIEMTIEVGAKSTIAIVKWSTDLNPIDSAYIEYGLDTNYGARANVDLSADEHRTAILGLKGGKKNYHFRTVITSDEEKHYGDDQTFTTGAVPNALPGIELTWPPNEPIKDKLEKGYIVAGNVNTDSPHIFILDADGDYVWWHVLEMFAGNDAFFPSQVVMDWEGKNLYAISGNAGFEDYSIIERVSIDGESEMDFTVPGGHHSLTAVPEGGVAFLSYDSNTGCDVVRYMDEEGNVTDVYDILEDTKDNIELQPDPGVRNCHANFVQYVASADAFAISVLGFDIALLAKRDKQLLWAIGRDTYQTAQSNPDWAYGGENEDFQAQHGLHVWNEGKGLLLFNNGASTFGQTAIIWEYTFNDALSSANGREYYSEDRLNAAHFGNAIRLPGGNTLIDYCTSRVIIQIAEVSQGKAEIVQKIELDQVIGYAFWTESLYDPPTHF